LAIVDIESLKKKSLRRLKERDLAGTLKSIREIIRVLRSTGRTTESYLIERNLNKTKQEMYKAPTKSIDILTEKIDFILLFKNS
jgi:hypothetical protein